MPQAALSFAAATLAASWHSLVESAPYLLFGFLVAGMLHAFVSTDLVARHLGGGRVASVVKAALLGVPLPLCSCGVLPAALDLRRKGASRGAVLSFLVSTPETGVDSMALSWVLLGPVLTAFRPLAAFVTAVAAGVLENVFGREGEAGPELAGGCGCAPPRVDRRPLAARLGEGLRYAFGDLLGDLAPWLGAGFLAAGVIGAAVPEGALERTLGAGPLAYLVMLAVGVPLYICATASTPVAAALLLKGLSPGAALVFLLAGPATNAASLTALAGTLGWRATLRYLAAIAGVSLAMGALLDALFPGAGRLALAGAGAAELLPPAAETACAAVLAALCLRPLLLRGRRSRGVARAGSS